MAGAAQVHGSCHCGAVRVTLELSRPADQTPLGACQCSFCRAHGAATVQDSGGRATIRVADAADLNPYRFELATADFLLCRNCGVYIAAVLKDGDQAWSTVNVHGLRVPEFLGHEIRAGNYEGETETERVARRKANWTPTVLNVGT